MTFRFVSDAAVLAQRPHAPSHAGTSVLLYRSEVLASPARVMHRKIRFCNLNATH